jgi:hypothetical protein
METGNRNTPRATRSRATSSIPSGRRSNASRYSPSRSAPASLRTPTWPSS